MMIMSKCKVFRIFIISILLLLLFTISTSALSVHVNAVGQESYILADKLTNVSVLRGVNRSSRVTVQLQLLFTGSIRDAMMWPLQHVLDGDQDLSSVLVFGDGLWYDSATLTDLATETNFRHYWYSTDTVDGDPIQYSGLYRTYAYITLVYTQNGGLPIVAKIGDDYTFDLYNGTKVDFTVNSPIISLTGVCYARIDSVLLECSSGQAMYLAGGDNPLSLYVANTYYAPSYNSQYNFENHWGVDIYENPTLKVSIAGLKNTPFTFLPDYRLSRFDTGNAVLPYVMKCDLEATNTDFTPYSLEFKPSMNLINGYELRYAFGFNEQNDFTKNYNPFVCCYSSYRYTDSVIVNNENATMGDYDISQLYVPIQFSTPSWDDELSFGENLKEMIVGILSAVLTLLGSIAYNAAVWIFCETPILSDYTRPLFTLMIEAGSFFTEFFIPVLGGLGFFTPIACVFFFIGFIRRNSR